MTEPQDQKKPPRIEDLRAHLKSGTLSGDELRYIDGVLLREDELQKGVTSEGRRIIVRLPFGMDIVK